MNSLIITKQKYNFTVCCRNLCIICSHCIFFLGFDLENGKRYVVIVRATDFVDLDVEATSNEFILDETPPVAGVLTIDPLPQSFNMMQVTTRYFRELRRLMLQKKNFPAKVAL